MRVPHFSPKRAALASFFLLIIIIVVAAAYDLTCRESAQKLIIKKRSAIYTYIYANLFVLSNIDT